VISLVQEVEDGLVELVRISGARMGDGKAEKRPEESAAAADNGQEGVDESDLKGRGPAVPGQDEGVVSGQDEVDDLLSSLGF
jgi:chemotaxis protein CheZ